MDILSLLSKKWTFPLLLIGIFFQTCIVVSESAIQDFNDTCNTFSDPCRNGLIIPRWEPTGNLSLGDKIARAIIYFVLMVYLFLGVSIIADRFMASIEVITSKEKDVTVKKPDGTTTIVSVRIWNETVSNLTLMALGSSAPEIMLSVIEICGQNFKAGDLGPSTIVGSAAFNLFIITAICIEVIPNGESRSIKHLSVFFITSIWSVFAYLWLYFILSVISYGIVEVWEAILTFLFFPATVVTAYVADRKLLNKFISKKYRASKQKGVVIQCEGLDAENADGKANHLGEDVAFKGLDSEETDVREFEQHRREYIEILREMRKKNPTLDMKTLEDMAEAEAVNRGPKSRAFYRIQATRKLTGGGNIIKKAKTQTSMQLSSTTDQKPEDEITKVCFDPGHYTVMENVGTFYGTVTREGGDLSKTLYVDYKTEDGTANAGSDYVYAEGTLVFYPMETHKQFPISIIDDDIFEEDEHFYIRLSNLRVGDSQGLFESGQAEAKAQLANPFLATVMILDDDHPGIFQIEEKEMYVTESSGEVEVRIIRTSGARGLVKVPFHSVDGTAVHGKDYELLDKEICFDNDENEKFLRVRVFDDEEYEKNETFFIWLDEPFLVKKPADTESAHSGSISRYFEECDVSCFLDETNVSVHSGTPYSNMIPLIERQDFGSSTSASNEPIRQRMSGTMSTLFRKISQSSFVEDTIETLNSAKVSLMQNESEKDKHSSGKASMPKSPSTSNTAPMHQRMSGTISHFFRKISQTSSDDRLSTALDTFPSSSYMHADKEKEKQPIHQSSDSNFSLATFHHASGQFKVKF
ncbi:sodium/calcium exchanger 3 isoform X1 [Octopus bimaculoides]|nr:sodium/calcium exchanger 3 isoform X1 [Octopus bimaculoides]